MDDVKPTKEPEISTPTLEQNSKVLFSDNFLLILLGGCAFLLIFVVMYLLFARQTLTQPIPSPNSDLYRAATPAGPDAVGANWKMYTNTKYGYSLLYPPDWSLEEYLSNVSIYSPNFENYGSREGLVSIIEGGQIVINVSGESSINSIDMLIDYYSDYFNDNPLNKSRTITYRTITFNNYPALRYDGAWTRNGDESNGVMILRNGKVYHLVLEYIDEKNIFQKFDQILSTFRFTQ